MAATFLKTTIKLGKVIVGQKYTMEFPWEGELNAVEIKPSCGCTMPRVEGDNKIMYLDFIPPNKNYTSKWVQVIEPNVIHILKFEADAR